MEDFGSPPWPLVLKLVWHGEEHWSIVAKEEMGRRFPNGMPDKWLLHAVEWWARNIDGRA